MGDCRSCGGQILNNGAGPASDKPGCRHRQHDRRARRGLGRVCALHGQSFGPFRTQKGAGARTDYVLAVLWLFRHDRRPDGHAVDAGADGLLRGRLLPDEFRHRRRGVQAGAARL